MKNYLTPLILNPLLDIEISSLHVLRNNNGQGWYI